VIAAPPGGSVWNRALGWEIGYTTGRYRSRIIKAGSGPPLILMHGQGGHVENFVRNIAAFAQSYRVYAFDFLWHGLSGPAKFDDRLIPAFRDQFLDLLESEGIGSCVVVGQSLGGWVASSLASDGAGDRMNALILVTPMGIEPDSTAAPTGAEARASLLRTSLEALDDPSLPNIRKRLARLVSDPSEIDDEMIAIRAAIYSRPETNASLRAVAQAYLGPDYRVGEFAVGPAELARITTPTLVYWGTHNATPQSVGQAARALLGDKNAEYHCAEAGHWAHYEKSGEFNATALDFLKRRARSTG
jgi:pimeloyl-ACP methyl ester carboxylesterase